MDAIEILGGLLGQKSGGSGLGTKILKDILMGGASRGAAPAPSQPAPAPAPRPSTPRSTSTPSRDYGGGSLEQQARELEDLLNVAKDRSARRTPPATANPPAQPKPQPPRQPVPPARPTSPYGSEGPILGAPQPRPAQIESDNDKALVLVRAMINAAKADGRVTEEEQQNILSQVGDTSAETIQFLRQEFAEPLNVRDFAWSVPLGMEQQVYMVSLVAIDLDSNTEGTYLKDLAHGLRLDPETCDQMHQRVGAPLLRR